MTVRHSSLSTGLVLAIGIITGWILAGGKSPAAFAHGGDRRGESVLLTGPIATEANPAMKIQITNDAVYYLNYSTGRLYASIPSSRQTTKATHILTEFAERDLVEDFQLSPKTPAHFLMTTGTMGALSEGWAPLYVLETTTGQIAVYRVLAQATVNSTKPNFVLLERRAADRRLEEYRPDHGVSAADHSRYPGRGAE